ncbi:hypothetical protein SUGI_0703120 [Cryptomeria japonica]|nr:hypothetical protein SUGI_0703120 [Cryptomeria japonica]
MHEPVQMILSGAIFCRSRAASDDEDTYLHPRAIYYRSKRGEHLPWNDGRIPILSTQSRMLKQSSMDQTQTLLLLRDKINEATRGFSESLGTGAFGFVCGGILSGGRRVAVKILGKKRIIDDKTAWMNRTVILILCWCCFGFRSNASKNFTLTV